MDIESNVEMTTQPFLGGVASLPSPKSHAEQIRDPNFNPEDDDEYLEQLPEWTMAEIATAVGAVGSIITSSVALIFAGINPIIWVTAIAGIIIPPYSALQQQKITDCKGKISMIFKRQTGFKSVMSLTKFPFYSCNSFGAVK